jgi:dsRNA-specific ribonuclease
MTALYQANFAPNPADGLYAIRASGWKFKRHERSVCGRGAAKHNVFADVVRALLGAIVATTGIHRLCVSLSEFNC